MAGFGSFSLVGGLSSETVERIVRFAFSGKREHGDAIMAPGRPVATHSALDIRKFGAGEGIRTLDPNLGKVVLYP